MNSQLYVAFADGVTLGVTGNERICPRRYKRLRALLRHIGPRTGRASRRATTALTRWLQGQQTIRATATTRARPTYGHSECTPYMLPARSYLRATPMGSKHSAAISKRPARFDVRWRFAASNIRPAVYKQRELWTKAPDTTTTRMRARSDPSRDSGGDCARFFLRRPTTTATKTEKKDKGGFTTS